MQLPPPERIVIDLLDRFRQLTTSHIRALGFPDAASRTTCDRVLQRMSRNELISRVVQPRGGVNVWSLGRAGWKLTGRPERWRARVISYHTLAIADVAVKLKEAERRGEVIVRSIVTEPECWVNVQGIDLRPDMDLEVERPGTGARLAVFIEVDLGTERQARITEKLGWYVDAYKRATRADLEELRRVVFVSETQARANEIAYLIGKLPEEQRRFFRSVKLETFPEGM